MSIKKLKIILDQMLQGIPGVMTVLMINQDGKLIYANGRFDTSPNELASRIAINLAAINMAGNLLGQEINTVLTEFNKIKIYQVKISAQYFLILLLKIKDIYFGEVRVKINKAVEDINNKIIAK